MLRPDGTVNLDRFTTSVKGRKARKNPQTGWEIDKDNAKHAGKQWKLKDKKGKRKASLDGKGKIISK